MLAVLMVMLVVWLLSLAGVVWLVRVADAEARAPEDREASDI